MTTELQNAIQRLADNWGEETFGLDPYGPSRVAGVEVQEQSEGLRDLANIIRGYDLPPSHFGLGACIYLHGTQEQKTAQFELIRSIPQVTWREGIFESDHRCKTLTANFGGHVSLKVYGPEA